MPVPPSPPLDQSISPGQPGHLADHEAIHEALDNDTASLSANNSFYPDNLPTPIDPDIPFQVGASKMLLANLNSELPTFIEMVRTGTPTGTEHARGSVGLLGRAGTTGAASASTEMNLSVNMDYSDGSHKYYDTTVSMIWSYLGNAVGLEGFGVQWVKAGHPQTPDPWTAYGKEVFNVKVIPNTSTGEAVQGGSRVLTQQIDLVDGLYGSGSAARLKAESQTTNGVAAVSLATGWWDSLTVQKTQNGANVPTLSLRKQLGVGVWNMGGAGVVTGLIETQGSVASIGFESTATVNGGFSNIEHVFKTTAAAGGAAAERFRIKEDGWLLIKNTPAAPGANPTAGGYLYVESGALKYRGSGGTVTTVAAA